MAFSFPSQMVTDNPLLNILHFDIRKLMACVFCICFLPYPYPCYLTLLDMEVQSLIRKLSHWSPIVVKCVD